MIAVDVRPVVVCPCPIISPPPCALKQIQATGAINRCHKLYAKSELGSSFNRLDILSKKSALGVIGYVARHQTMALEPTPVVSNKSLCRSLVLLTSIFLFTGAPLLSQSSSTLASRGYSVLP